MRRLPRQHRFPRTIRAILLLGIDWTAIAPLHYRTPDRRATDMVRPRPPTIHLLGEHAKRLCHVRSHPNALAHRARRRPAHSPAHSPSVSRASSLLHDPGFEGLQSLAAEAVEVRPQRIESPPVEPIVAPRSNSLVPHKLRHFQHPKMLRHRWTAHCQPVRQLAHRQRAFPQSFHEHPPGRIAERIELVLMVSIHLW